ncbi:MAG: ThiF family adenylyltransferase [Bacteroidetes bacterium]|nr:ThiF family adenylyltransferase [Bacteroidota bacterium]
MLSQEEIERYSRQIRLPEFGIEAQHNLKNAKILVVGAGALGCAVLNYLSASGIGKIGIIDGDKVELSNLHRQVLFSSEDIGESKAEVAQKKLSKINQHIDFQIEKRFLTVSNAFNIVEDYDIIIDGTDNFPTRYLVNDLCFFTDKINVHGSIQGFQGQVAVFNAPLENGRSANYRDLYPTPPLPEDSKSCAENGVIGALPGIIGAMMALEAIKLAAGLNSALCNSIFQIDTLTFQTNTLIFRKDPENPLTRKENRQNNLINYQEFCGLNKQEMKTINVQELKKWQAEGVEFQLIDVREPAEFDEANMEGLLIPLQQVPSRMEEINKEGKVVIHCRSGARSANAIQYLNQHGYDNLYNLEGGIIAWLSQQ